MIDRPRAALLMTALVAFGLAGGLSGCNTVEGMGADVSATGDWIGSAFDSSDDGQSRPATTASPAPSTGTGATGGPTRTSP